MTCRGDVSLGAERTELSRQHDTLTQAADVTNAEVSGCPEMAGNWALTTPETCRQARSVLSSRPLSTLPHVSLFLETVLAAESEHNSDRKNTT